MKKPPKELFAWFMEGEDSFMAVLLEDLWYPLVFSDEDKATQPRVHAIVKETVTRVGKSAVLRSYKFDKIVGGIG